jgi:hypothetical protein
VSTWMVVVYISFFTFNILENWIFISFLILGLLTKIIYKEWTIDHTHFLEKIQLGK